MSNKSKVVPQGRATKFKMGGPRKYPSKYVWQIIDNNLSLQEVRYFKNKKYAGYYFFTLENSILTRNSKVPSDLTLFDSVKDAYNNIPGISLLDKWY